MSSLKTGIGKTIATKTKTKLSRSCCSEQPNRPLYRCHHSHHYYCNHHNHHNHFTFLTFILLDVRSHFYLLLELDVDYSNHHQPHNKVIILVIISNTNVIFNNSIAIKMPDYLFDDHMNVICIFVIIIVIILVSTALVW